MSRLFYLPSWPLISRILTTLATAAVVLSVFLTAGAFSGIKDPLFRYAVACVTVQTTILVLLTLALGVGKFLALRKASIRAARIRTIETALSQALHPPVGQAGVGPPASDRDALRAIWRLASKHPREFLQVCDDALNLLKGSTRQALESLLISTSPYQNLLRHTTSPNPTQALRAISILANVDHLPASQAIEQALDHPVSVVRMHARIALLCSGAEPAQRRILEDLPRLPFWQRVVVLHHLPQESPLLTEFVSEAIHSDRDEKILAGLELVLGRQRLLPVAGASSLSESPNPEVRIKFFKALPFMLDSQSPAAALRAGLSDPDWRVRAMAARACAQMRFTECAPQLRELLASSENSVEAGHAARALAKMGGDVWKSLQQFVWSGSEMARRTATSALESKFILGAER